MTTRHEIKERIARTSYSRRFRGKMGRDNGSGSFTSTVPGGGGMVYVRYANGAVTTLSIAINRAGVSTTGDTPIYLEYDEDDRLIIVGTAYEGS